MLCKCSQANPEAQRNSNDKVDGYRQACGCLGKTRWWAENRSSVGLKVDRCLPVACSSIQ